MITLQNDKLNIQILVPGSSYKRSRFDWSGICQQVTLDGAHPFCSREATDGDPGTEGIGLIDEFGITTPIGYPDIEVGEWFPKIGVGFLQKIKNEPYNFFADYPIQPAPFKVEQLPNRVVSFTQNCESAWGWNLQKTILLDGANLTIDCALKNIGEKPLVTEQYNHNFIAINGNTIGPDYQLQTSFSLNFDVLDGGIVAENNKLNLTEIPPNYIYAQQSDCTGMQNVEWSLVHQPSGRGLRVYEKFKPSKFAVWAKSHVISPEFFIGINLQPGETQAWQRTYTFF